MLVGVGLVARAASPRWGRAIEWGGLLAAVATLVFGALSWGDGPLGVLGLLVQLAVVSGAIGGVFAAMILGHWYLVTPKLPEAPLILLARCCSQWSRCRSCSSGPGSRRAPVRPMWRPFSALVGPWALFVWLRLIIGLVFPLAICWAAVQTARTRSMESATGLLYINVGTIAAGTILAAGLYFGAGLLV